MKERERARRGEEGRRDGSLGRLTFLQVRDQKMGETKKKDESSSLIDMSRVVLSPLPPPLVDHLRETTNRPRLIANVAPRAHVDYPSCVRVILKCPCYYCTAQCD